MREALVCAQEVTSKLTSAIDANDKMAEQVEMFRAGEFHTAHKPNL